MSKARINIHTKAKERDEAVAKIIKKCLDIIEESEISAALAETIPMYLKKSIEDSNRSAQWDTAFKAYPADE